VNKMARRFVEDILPESDAGKIKRLEKQIVELERWNGLCMEKYEKICGKAEVDRESFMRERFDKYVLVCACIILAIISIILACLL